MSSGARVPDGVSTGLAIVAFVALSVATAIVREPFHDEGVTSDQVAGPLRLDQCERGCTVAQLRASPYARPQDVIRALRERGLHPPAYYLLLFAWTRIAGLNILSLRIPGIVMGALAVLGLSALGGRLVGTSLRPFAAWLAALSPWLVQVSAYARPYSMAVAAAVFSSWLLVSASERRRWVTVVAWAGVSAVGTYTVYHYAFVVAIQAALWLWRGPGYPRGRLVMTTEGLLLWLLLYAPWLPAAWQHVQHASEPFYFHGRLPALAWAPASVDLLSRFLLGALAPRYAPVLALVLGGLVAAILIKRRHDHSPGLQITLFYLGGVAALMLLVDQIADTHTLFVGKTAFALYPAIIVVLAAASGYLSAGRLAVAGILGLATVLQVGREAQTSTDIQRVAAFLRSQGEAEQQLVVVSHSKRGFVYPLLIELERSGLNKLRVAVADESRIAATVHGLLETGGVKHLTLLEFGSSEGNGNPWPSKTLEGIVRSAGTSTTLFRDVVPHRPLL